MFYHTDLYSRISSCLFFHQVDIIPNGCIIIGHDGLIAAIGTTVQLSSQFRDAVFQNDIDGTGKSVVPGVLYERELVGKLGLYCCIFCVY